MFAEGPSSGPRDPARTPHPGTPYTQTSRSDLDSGLRGPRPPGLPYTPDLHTSRPLPRPVASIPTPDPHPQPGTRIPGTRNLQDRSPLSPNAWIPASLTPDLSRTPHPRDPSLTLPAALIPGPPRHQTRSPRLVPSGRVWRRPADSPRTSNSSRTREGLRLSAMSSAAEGPRARSPRTRPARGPAPAPVTIATTAASRRHGAWDARVWLLWRQGCSGLGPWGLFQRIWCEEVKERVQEWAG